MSLAFLSKKSWHTAKISNQEKVWIAEQQKANEDSKMKELARQIQLEREREEMDRIAGKKRKTDLGVDWMYDHGMATSKENQESEREAYLLGKEYVPGESTAEGGIKGTESQGLDNVVTGIAARGNAGQLVDDSQHPEDTTTIIDGPEEEQDNVFDRNEEFRRRHEDPMFLVSQSRTAMKRDVEKKTALFEKVGYKAIVRRGDDDDNERRRRRSPSESSSVSHVRRKDKKKHKDHRRRHKRRREKERRGSRRSRSREREERRRRKRSRSREPAEEDGEGRPKRRCEEKQGYRRHDGDRYHRRSHSRDREWRRDRDDDRARRYHRRSHSIDGDRDNDRHRDRDRTRDRNRNRSKDQNTHRDKQSHHHHYPSPPPKPSGYGLQNNTSSTNSPPPSPTTLGPDPSLLQTKLRDKQALQDQRRHHRRRRLTSREREERRREMQEDATRRDNDLHAAVTRGKEEKERDGQEGGGGENAGFLTEVKGQAHGLEGGAMSLAERVRRNRYTNQREGDNNFL